MFPRIVLGLSALVYVGIGLAFIFAPESLLPRVNIAASSGTALADIRAVYGGLDLGVGVLLAYCLMRNEIRTGLLACVFTLGGLALGRVYGILLDTEQDSITYGLLAAELIGAATAVVGLRMLTSSTAAAPHTESAG